MDLENWLLTLHLRKISKAGTSQIFMDLPGILKGNLKKRNKCFGHLN